MSTDEVLAELNKISKILTISNGVMLEKELSKYATTDDRKKIWILIDGIRQADDIVKISGLTKTPVYNFLKMLEDSNLIERQHGKAPRRLLDYVPPGWTDLIQTNSKQNNNEQKESITPATQGEQHG